MIRLFFFVFLLVAAVPSFSQQIYDYADSTQLLLQYSDESDTAAIEQLRQELNATILAVTPLTRVFLWQVPNSALIQYGGPGGILNHAKGKARIKGGELNYDPNMILEIDDDDDDEWTSTDPCFYSSSFSYTSAANPVKVAFLDTGIDGEYPQDPTGTYSLNHPEFDNRLQVNVLELNGIANVDDDHNGLIDDV